jgi:polyhydroxyalkanoate synthesis repressor PhaR
MALHSNGDAPTEPTVIKKYANRRLYNTGTSTYVTLDDLAHMVKGGEDFLVHDAKTGEDLTRAVLAQIIFDQENRGTNLLPITVLRQLIRFYDDSVHAVVPSYLEHSINAFVADRESITRQLANNFGASPLGAVGAMSEAMQEQTRRNMELFQSAMSNAMTVFVPFSGASSGEVGKAGSKSADGKQADPRQAESRQSGSKQGSTGLDELRAQLSAMQSKLDSLSGDD